MPRQLIPKPIPARDPDRYTFPIRPVDKEFLVQSIKVVMQTGNHASIYLIISRGFFSIRLNMCPDADFKGGLDITTCYYDTPRSEVASITLPVRRLWRVHDYISFIRRKGRHLYWFHETGMGCRFWVNTVINDLDNLDGPLSSPNHASSRRVLEFLRFRYSQGWRPQLEEILPGSFYRT